MGDRKMFATGGLISPVIGNGAGMARIQFFCLSFFCLDNNFWI